MNKSNFLVSCAKHVFVFSAVLMASVALSSCSKSDDESNELPIKQNTVIIDKEEKPILHAGYTNTSGANDYEFTFFLSKDYTEKVKFLYNKNRHCNKDIDLTKREERHDGVWYWSIDYHKKYKQIIDTDGQPKALYGSDEPILPVFDKGTLRISDGEGNNIKILLKNGKVVGADNKPHTITIHYDGPRLK